MIGTSAEYSSQDSSSREHESWYSLLLIVPKPERAIMNLGILLMTNEYSTACFVEPHMEQDYRAPSGTMMVKAPNRRKRG